MDHNEDLARLEQFVEKLIVSHNQLKNENDEVKAKLQAKQQEIAELQEMIKNLQEDRSVMHNRVTGLLDRIDDWEKTFAQEGSGQNSSSGNGESQSLSNKSSSLFSVAEDQPSESALR
jgi:predicted nuclease with TOPRIM domain